MSNRLLKIVFPVLLIGVAVFGFQHLKATKPERAAPKAREKVWHVDTILARASAESPTLTLYGIVETPVLTRLAAPGAAVVDSVSVRDGQRVHQGESLVLLDQRDFEPEVLQARADVMDLKAQIMLAEIQYRSDQRALANERRLLKLSRNALARAQRLRKQKSISERDLDNAQTDVGKQELALTARQLAVDGYKAKIAQLNARHERNQARLRIAELALVRSRLSAPYDGVVTDVAVSLGDRVQTSQVLVSLYPLHEIEVRAQLAARYQFELRDALEAGVPLRAQATAGGRTVALELVRFAGDADISGVDAFFRFTEPSSIAYPGNLLEMTLKRPPQADSISVPYQAVYGNHRIYVLEDGRMKGLEVEVVGRHATGTGESRLLIRSPAISPGMEIVATHLPNAVEGLKVKTGNQKRRPGTASKGKSQPAGGTQE